MGLADLFLKFGLGYGSPASVRLLQAVMGFIQTTSWDESQRLAHERGVPEHCVGVGRRNITTTSIAPTGSIAFIARCSHGIEPVFAPKYIRTDERDEEYTFEHPQASEPHFRSSINGDHTKMPTYVEHLLIQAAAQSECDSGVSKTINFPNGARVEDIYDAILRAWALGCKGLSVYRDGSRLKQVLEVAKEEDATLIDCPTGVCTI
jgi:ribonucleoside-diphosphate reductase alpha chain